MKPVDAASPSPPAALVEDDLAGAFPKQPFRLVAHRLLTKVASLVGRRNRTDSAYSSPIFIEAMRQAALGRWMEYHGSAEQIARAFAFARADGAEAYYARLSSIAVENSLALFAATGKPISVLEVGAGVARLSFDLAQADVVERVVALEQSATLVAEIEALALGKVRQVRVPVTATTSLTATLRPPVAAPNLTARRGNAGSVPFADAEFDLVVGMGLVDRVQEPRRVVAEMARVLRPCGVAIVTFLHDCPGGPAGLREWFGSATTLFTGKAWSRVDGSQRQRLDLRQNAGFFESFNAEIVVARRAP